MHPKQAIFPAICVAALLLFFLSQSVYGFSRSSASNYLIPKQSLSLHTINPSYSQEIREWESIIRSVSADTGLDPDLISALIMIESAGQPDVISSSGAVGLMQVMPSDGKAATFQCVNGPCFHDRPSTSELMRPEYNIFFGSTLLSSLIADHGSLREGLRAYGPMDVGYAYAEKVLALYLRYQGK